MANDIFNPFVAASFVSFSINGLKENAENLNYYPILRRKEELYLFLSTHREWESFLCRFLQMLSTAATIKVSVVSLTNSRGSKVAVAVAGPKSRSRVQSRGRGSKVAVGGRMSLSRVQCRGRGKWFWVRGLSENGWYEHNIKGYSTVANLQVTDVRVNKIMSQEKT